MTTDTSEKGLERLIVEALTACPSKAAAADQRPQRTFSNIWSNLDHVLSRVDTGNVEFRRHGREPCPAASAPMSATRESISQGKSCELASSRASRPWTARTRFPFTIHWI